MSQSHFTLSFPLKQPFDPKALSDQLTPLMPALFKAEDAIGTVHYSRFTVLSERTLLFLGDFDGEFGQLVSELAKSAGPVFDAIFAMSTLSRHAGGRQRRGVGRMGGRPSRPSAKPLYRLPQRDRQRGEGFWRPRLA